MIRSYGFLRGINMEPQTYFDINEIEKLVEEYECLKDEDKQKYSERDVNTKFIQRLLNILGWDINSIDEVREEASSGKDSIDISLMIFGIPKLIVELRKFGTLDGNTIRRKIKMSYEEQLLDYAWQKKIDWGLLTNFEEFRLFFTHVKSNEPKDGLIISLRFDELLTKKGYEFLEIISKKGISDGLLENLQLKETRASIDTDFSKNLLIIRNTLMRKVSGLSPNTTRIELHMIVQRILNRLIMLRYAEDWNVISAESLKNTLKYWTNNTIDKDAIPLYEVIKEHFKGFNGTYNAKIFAPHPSDDVKVENDALKDTIETFYRYNFDEIGANILGDVYEEYLGHVLKELKNGELINHDHLNKQKMGIYYTKPHIVKYILSRTVLSGIKTLGNEAIRELKVIDISCGSGSFLIEAYDVLERQYYLNEKRTTPANLPLKHNLLQQHLTSFWKEVLPTIFGIDMDPIASEIASVSLALRSLSKNQKLSMILGKNIKTLDGLSKIDFNDWIPNFNGFDYVIGNPPYVLGDDLDRETHDQLKTDFPEIYASEADYSYYFIKKGIDLLKPAGRLGFIITKYFLKAFYGNKTRQFILKNSKIIEIIDFGNIDVFEGIGSRCCIIVLEKDTSPKKEDHEIKVIRYRKRNVRGEKSKVFTQIFEIQEKLKEEKTYVNTMSLEGYYLKQNQLSEDLGSYLLDSNKIY